MQLLSDVTLSWGYKPSFSSLCQLCHGLLKYDPPGRKTILQTQSDQSGTGELRSICHVQNKLGIGTDIQKILRTPANQYKMGGTTIEQWVKKNTQTINGVGNSKSDGGFEKMLEPNQ